MQFRVPTHHGRGTSVYVDVLQNWLKAWKAVAHADLGLRFELVSFGVAEQQGVHGAGWSVARYWGGWGLLVIQEPLHIVPVNKYEKD